MRKRRRGLNFRRQRHKVNVAYVKEVALWVAEIILVLLLSFVIVNFFGYRTSVVGQAMEATLSNGEQILVNRFVYVIFQPKPGDVVVFLPNGNEKSHYYVRRVIAGPGDTVQIENGAVYVNGNLYEETVKVSSIEEAGMAAEEITLDQGEYFVLGDNRNNSEDSRFANIGNIKEEHIVGKAWFHINSFGDMGFIH